MSEIATTHSVERTSPLGERFIGRCVLCGEDRLTMGGALKPCPNPRGVTADDAVLTAIERAAPIPEREGGVEP